MFPRNILPFFNTDFRLLRYVSFLSVTTANMKSPNSFFALSSFNVTNSQKPTAYGINPSALPAPEIKLQKTHIHEFTDSQFTIA
jgi:hypothetical protein